MPKMDTLNLIGDTRWWAKDVCLRKVFGSFDDPKSGCFKKLVQTLAKIGSTIEIDADARFKAINLSQSLCKFKTILTAQIFLRLFKHTTPLSKYLQTKEMSILHAQ